jgi:hypothetical protein
MTLGATLGENDMMIISFVDTDKKPKKGKA